MQNKNVHSTVRDQGSNKLAFKLTSSMRTHLSKAGREEEHPGQREYYLQRSEGGGSIVYQSREPKGPEGVIHNVQGKESHIIEWREK